MHGSSQFNRSQTMINNLYTYQMEFHKQLSAKLQYYKQINNLMESLKNGREMLTNKSETLRRSIRTEEHQQFMKERRKQIINERYPLKSATFGALLVVPADELPHLSAEINGLLARTQLDLLSPENLSDLIDDLSYLLHEADFELTSPLTFPKTGEPLIASFVAQFFTILQPLQVSAWCDCMSLEDRKYLYCGLTSSDQEYLTDNLVKNLVLDLEELEAIELIDEMIDAGKGHRLMKVNLIVRIADILKSKTKIDLLYFRVANNIALLNLKQGFSRHLISIIFTNALQATNLELITFASLANNLHAVNLNISSYPELLNFSLQIEKRSQNQQLNQGLNLLLSRSIVKLFVFMIENNRKIGLDYKLSPKTIRALKQVGTNQDTQVYAKKILKLMNIQ